MMALAFLAVVRAGEAKKRLPFSSKGAGSLKCFKRARELSPERWLG